MVLSLVNMAKELGSKGYLRDLVEPERATSLARPLLKNAIPVRSRYTELADGSLIVRPPAYPARLRNQLPELLIASGAILASNRQVSRRTWLKGMVIAGAALAASSTLPDLSSSAHAEVERHVTRVDYERASGRVSNPLGPMSTRKEGEEATGINFGGAADQHDELFYNFWGFPITEIYSQGTREFLTGYFNDVLARSGDDGWEWRAFCPYSGINNIDGPLYKRSTPILGMTIAPRIQGLMLNWMYEKSRYHDWLDPYDTQRLAALVADNQCLIGNYSKIEHQTWWGGLKEVQPDGTLVLARFLKWADEDGLYLEPKSPGEIRQLFHVNSSFALSAETAGAEGNMIVDPVIVQLAAGMYEVAA